MLLLPILMPVIGGIFLFRQTNEERCNRLALGLVLATGLLALTVCLLPWRSMELLVIQGPLRLVLSNDGLARFFMILIAGIWALVTVFSFPYIHHVGGANQYQGFSVMALGILMGLSMAANFVTMYMFFEMMSLLTMPLVLHNATPSARRAGFKYLGFSVFGAGMALAGYFFLAGCMKTQSFTLGGVLHPELSMEHRPLLLVMYVLMLVGFGAKAGMMPMQAWLPAAHPEAPAPASAVLSGLITKGGVLAAIRVTYYMFGPAFLRDTWAQKVLLAAALCTVFVGSMLAYREKQLKRRLAYSTVSQVSYVLFGVLLLTPEGFRGALLQVVFHALAKNVLFLAAGAIIFSTGYTRVDQLRGIGRRMPWTLACFTAAALSLIGIPPMAGFVSKWVLVDAGLQCGPVGIAGLVVLILSALLTAGYLLPIITAGYFPGSDVITERKEVGPWMLRPMLVLSGLLIVLGMFPGGINSAILQLLQ